MFNIQTLRFQLNEKRKVLSHLYEKRSQTEERIYRVEMEIRIIESSIKEFSTIDEKVGYIIAGKVE